MILKNYIELYYWIVLKDMNDNKLIRTMTKKYKINKKILSRYN